MKKIYKMLIFFGIVKSAEEQGFMSYPTRPLSHVSIPDTYFGLDTIWTPKNSTRQLSYYPSFTYPESQLRQSPTLELESRITIMPEPYQKSKPEQGSVAPKVPRPIRGRGLMLQNSQANESYESKSYPDNIPEEVLFQNKSSISSPNFQEPDELMHSFNRQHPLASSENYDSVEATSETTKDDFLLHSHHHFKDNHGFRSYRHDVRQYNPNEATLLPKSLGGRYLEDFDLRSRLYHDNDTFFQKILNILVKRRSLRQLGKKVMTPFVVCIEIFDALEYDQIQISMFFAFFCFISRDFISYGNCIWIKRNKLVLGKHKEVFVHKTILKRELFKWKELNIQATSFYQGLEILYSFGKGISESLVDELKLGYYNLFRGNVYRVFKEIWEK